MESRADRDRIPVLVVSGFLGAGKTTLVRRLLAEAQAAGERLGVVVNDFGSLGIDRALLGAGATRSVELAGGCVCCELSDELVEVLEELRRSAPVDRIVIETSGLALPYETQLSLWRPPVSVWACDDMAVVLVNAEQLVEARDLGDLFEQQVSAADLVVLNQIDRVSEAEIPALEARLRAIDPEVPIVRAVGAELDPMLLRPADAAPRAAPEPRAHDHGVHRRYAAETIDVEPGLAPDALVARLRALGAVRAKGYVQTAEGPRLVQGVGRRIELTPATPPDPALLGRLVVIRAADASNDAGRA